MEQHELMRRLHRQFNGNADEIIAAYAEAERQGQVARQSNLHNLEPDVYAKALLADGLRRGWLHPE